MQSHFCSTPHRCWVGHHEPTVHHCSTTNTRTVLPLFPVILYSTHSGAPGAGAGGREVNYSCPSGGVMKGDGCVALQTLPVAAIQMFAHHEWIPAPPQLCTGWSVGGVGHVHPAPCRAVPVNLSWQHHWLTPQAPQSSRKMVRIHDGPARGGLRAICVSGMHARQNMSSEMRWGDKLRSEYEEKIFGQSPDEKVKGMT